MQAHQPFDPNAGLIQPGHRFNPNRGLLLAAAAVLAALLTAPGFALEPQRLISDDGVWHFDEGLSSDPEIIAGQTLPREFRAVTIDPARLAATLDRRGISTASSPEAWEVIELPMPDGRFERLYIWEDPILSAEMQAEYPHIRTYAGRGVDDLSLTARLDLTAQGFHAQLIGADGTVRIDPLQAEAGVYMSFFKRDAIRTEPFMCGSGDPEQDVLHAVRPLVEASTQGVTPQVNPLGGVRKTYRMRIVTTKEYTNFAPNPVDRVTTTMNRVNGIYESELGISFQLVTISALTGSSIAGCDYPFADNPSVNDTLLTQNNDYLNCRFSSGSWDIGHLFGAGGGGGRAQLGSACTSGKGRAATQLSDPSGDRFDVDYVSHEIGHQLNAQHTFNGNAGSCAGQRVQNSAYEPGSGSTIMAYADICGSQNVQSFSDDYFHTHSLDQISDFSYGSHLFCGLSTSTTGSPPNVNAGPNYTIPQGTPFTLTATGSHPDGLPLTYTWEQYDLGIIPGNPDPGNPLGPLFRSRAPSDSPSRTFPQLEDILTQTPTPYEVLPQVDREMTFRVTARDGEGGLRRDSMTLSVLGAPFEVIAPLESQNLECGVLSAVAWTVGGGGSVAQNLRIRFSSDNGTNFSTVLESTPNDGFQNVQLPPVKTTQARVMVEAIENIFFNVSRPFTIEDTLPPTVTAPPDIIEECTSPSGTPVMLGTATAVDLCEGTISSVSNNAPSLFPLGDTEVTWQSSDSNGNTGSDTQHVTIEDSLPPVLDVSVSPAVLWPPDHRMVRITADVFVEDICDSAPTFKLVSITSNEPDNSTGDGMTVGDIQGAQFGTADTEFYLRAERSGEGDGRIYTITYEASDASGNTTIRSLQVLVPRDLRP